jgi:energy-coupling factor transport system ATP-binding protein
VDRVRSERAAIQVDGLHVRYPGAHALRGIDLSIAGGSFVLLGGRSGSGKSTLARALLGLLNEEYRLGGPEVAGHIVVGGLSPARHSVPELATRVGLVFQNPTAQLFNGTVGEEIAFGPRNLGLGEDEVGRRVGYAMEAVACQHLRGRSVRHLSGGEQQRVAIAATLAMRPSILILDEPTANLDAEGTRAVAQAVARLHRELDMTVVVIEHRLRPFLADAQRLIWLTEGKIAADGPPENVLSRVDAREGTASRSWRPGPPLVSLERVTAGYNGRVVLRDCSLTLREGEFAALVGPNGSGKSTLARVLAGLLRPRKGHLVWHRRGRAGQRIGFLHQNPLHQLVCDTVEDEIRFAPQNLKLEGYRGQNGELSQLFSCTGLSGLRHRPTQALSVGEQQRTALAAVLSAHPRLLILDEPTMGQDSHHLREVMDLVGGLNDGGQTVLLITHDRGLVARYAGRVWEMMEGCAREVQNEICQIP